MSTIRTGGPVAAGPEQGCTALRPAQGERGLQQAHEERQFCLPVRVYWEDTDAGGIVFYANYLKFFERARTEWLRSLGIEQSRLRETTGGIFVVSETAVRYLQPARLDDELLVSAGLERAGPASLVIAQEALHKKTRLLLSHGRIRIGWVDAVTLKPARIPPIILEVLKT